MSVSTTVDSSTVEGAVIVVPYDDDPFDTLCSELFNRAQAPDLTQQVILMPQTLSASRLRRKLLDHAQQQGYPALLGPSITTLHDWLNNQITLALDVIHPAQRELLLVEAIEQHRGLCGQSSPWALAASLAPLFDELTQAQQSLADNPQQFIARLQRGYQLKDNIPSALSQEANIVFTLWQSWQRQQQDEAYCDISTAYTRQLHNSTANAQDGQHLYLLGYNQLNAAETSWLTLRLHNQQATLLLHGDVNEHRPQQTPHPAATLQRILTQIKQPLPAISTATPPPYTVFLNTLYSGCPDNVTEQHLGQRMQQFANQHSDSPLASRLRIAAADNSEQQAQIVALQTRLWLAQDCQRIGIVTDDRRLARRLRALLERSAISLQDQAGWALSTTSAATALERLLQCVEEDFDHLPLLDLLKSPYILPDWSRQTRAQAVYWFERDIVRHENISRGLERYRRHVQWRQKRLDLPHSEHSEHIGQLLDTIETASQALRSAKHQAWLRPATFLDALMNSLQQLGLTTSYADDPAGIALLDTLQQLSSAATSSHLRMNWSDFRAWLGRALEHATFHNAANDQRVQLMTLEQSVLQRFDAIIIAGADIEQYPGQRSITPFFNDKVRHELGLTTQQEFQENRLNQFMCLLHAAPQLLLSWQCYEDDKEVAPSPWLALLMTSHQLAYQQSLLDETLKHWVQLEAQRSHISGHETLPAVMARPQPKTASALLPKAYSATSYQRLIDCPYLFYSADCLGLKAPDSIQQALEKSDYGQRVHKILQAFHGNVAGLPGPFEQTITNDNRAAALRCLDEISQAVFAQDLEDNALHRGWLQRWQEQMPAYLDWQTQRQQHWQVNQLEEQLTQTLDSSTVTIQGRLDRIDEANQQHAIIDYKTGKAADQTAVDEGEAVQLPFYALLTDNVSRAEYLLLDKNLKTGAVIKDEQLITIKNATAQRLITMDQALQQGAAVPAWGDEKSCRHCPMSGVCRKALWAPDELNPQQTSLP